MADLVSITNALAAQITKHTGLRALGQARDSVQPPVAVILPGQPFMTYGATMDETLIISLMILVIITDAAPVEKTQRALDAYLGIGAGETDSIPAAVLADTTLAGTVHYCEPVSVSNYGRVEYSGVGYFGARVNLTIGAFLCQRPGTSSGPGSPSRSCPECGSAGTSATTPGTGSTRTAAATAR